jgi:hypothetical protein
MISHGCRVNACRKGSNPAAPLASGFPKLCHPKKQTATMAANAPNIATAVQIDERVAARDSASAATCFAKFAGRLSGADASARAIVGLRVGVVMDD